LQVEFTGNDNDPCLRREVIGQLQHCNALLDRILADDKTAGQ
jgi:hypothetical protein